MPQGRDDPPIDGGTAIKAITDLFPALGAARGSNDAPFPGIVAWGNELIAFPLTASRAFFVGGVPIFGAGFALFPIVDIVMAKRSGFIPLMAIPALADIDGISPFGAGGLHHLFLIIMDMAGR